MDRFGIGHSTGMSRHDWIFHHTSREAHPIGQSDEKINKTISQTDRSTHSNHLSRRYDADFRHFVYGKMLNDIVYDTIVKSNLYEAIKEKGTANIKPLTFNVAL